jgi:hypothetical protein
MPRLLSEDAIAGYRRDGFHFPVDVLSEAETGDLRRRLEAHEAETGGPIQGDRRHKAHLYLTWLNDLIRHPRILDAVEDVLGPDQGGLGSRFCLLASGCDVLGPELA